MASREVMVIVKDIPEVKAVIEQLTAERDEAREKLRTIRAAAEVLRREMQEATP